MGTRTRKILCLWLLILQVPSFADFDHETPPPSKPDKSRPKPKGGRTQETGPQGGPADGCRVQPSELASIANGESGNLQPVVTFLTSPQCAINYKAISEQAIAQGI